MAWSKLLKHGQTIAEPSSWSRTQTDDLVGVELTCMDKKLALYGQASYWQSDMFENQILAHGKTMGVCIKRRIERFISKPEIGFIIDNSDRGTLIDFRPCHFGANYPILNFINNYNVWLILEIDTRSKQVKHYTSKDRI